MAECNRGIHDVNAFLRMSSRNEPVYVEFRNNVGIAPLWGQYGGWLRLEVVQGIARRERHFNINRARGREQWATAELEIKPFVLGQRQRLATGSGGILDDNIGIADGDSRGLIVPEATTNKMTNPVYSHATYNNGWSSDASLVVSQNTDGRFLLPGTTSSAKITSRGANQEHYQSINAGNTNNHTLSCYAKRPDGAAVTSSDVVLFYNVALTTVFTSVGDGWYRLTWEGAGINASEETGAQIKSGRTVYLTGWQFEEKDTVTPLCWGDLIGCAWTGTAHASTSTRTAGLLTIPVAADTFNLGDGTIRAAVKMNLPSTDVASTTANYIFHCGASSFALLWDETNTEWQLTDGTNTVVVTDNSYAAGELFVFHATWTGGALQLYINRVAAVAGSYTPPAAPSVISIGSSTTGGFHGNVTVMDFATFDRAMTSAEVTADYNNLYQVISDGQRLTPLPYLWNKDGDRIADNCDDSTRDNWVAAMGIAGDVPAVTEYDLTRSNNGTVELFISNIVHDIFLPPSRTVFFDQSGTSNANSCGGEYLETIPVGSAAVFVGTGLTDAEYAVLAGKEVVAITRLAFTANTDPFKVGLQYGSVTTSEINSSGKNITGVGTTIAGNYRLYRSDKLVLPEKRFLFLDEVSLDDTNQYYQVTVGRDGSTHRMDYFAILPRPFVVLVPTVATGSGTQSVWLKGNKALTYVSGVPEAIVTVRGDVMDLQPNKVNILMSFSGDSSEDPTITRTLTYNKVMITPRWSLR